MTGAGATVDGVSTTGIASAIRFDTGVNPAGRRIINSLISNIYVEFVDLVARGRGLSWDQVNDIAGGLVWSGRDALDIGFGGFSWWARCSRCSGSHVGRC